MKRLLSFLMVFCIAQVTFSVDYTINASPVRGALSSNVGFEVLLNGHKPGETAQINMARVGTDGGPECRFGVEIYVGTNAAPIVMNMVDPSPTATFILPGSWMASQMRFIFFDNSRSAGGSWPLVDTDIEIVGEALEEGENVYFTAGNKCLQFNSVTNDVSNPSVDYGTQTVNRCAGYTVINGDGLVQRYDITPYTPALTLYEGIEAADISRIGDELYAADVDGKVYIYGVSGWSQFPLGGNAVAIDVDNDGTIWAAMNFGAVSKKRPNNNYWEQAWDSNNQITHKTVTDIGAGNGSVWVVAEGDVFEQVSANRWENRGFYGHDAWRIDVSPTTGTAWVLDGDGTIWEYVGGNNWSIRESSVSGKTDIAF